MNKKVIAITYATDDTDSLKDWLQTATKFGYHPIILGLGDKWISFRQRVKACYDKLKELKQNNKCSRDQIIVITDAYDVLFNCPAEELATKFRGVGKNILVGMESHCGLNCVGEIPIKNDTKYKFFNAGVMMGYCPDLIDFYKKSFETEIADDQISFGKVCTSQEYIDKIHFDVDRTFVTNVVGSDKAKLSYDNDAGCVLIDGKRSFIIHFPGTTTDLFRRENYIRKKLIGDHRKANTIQILKATQNKMKKYFYIILFVIVVIILIIFIAKFFKKK